MTSYNKIWNATRSVLSNSHLKFKEAETLTGKEEAIYGWTALNYLKKGFSEKVMYTPIHCVKFSASIDDLLEYNGSQGANGLD